MPRPGDRRRSGCGFEGLLGGDGDGVAQAGGQPATIRCEAVGGAGVEEVLIELGEPLHVEVRVLVVVDAGLVVLAVGEGGVQGQDGVEHVEQVGAAGCAESGPEGGRTADEAGVGLPADLQLQRHPPFEVGEKPAAVVERPGKTPARRRVSGRPASRSLKRCTRVSGGAGGRSGTARRLRWASDSAGVITRLLHP
jgi:hypothetical protein